MTMLLLTLTRAASMRPLQLPATLPAVAPSPLDGLHGGTAAVKRDLHSLCSQSSADIRHRRTAVLYLHASMTSDVVPRRQRRRRVRQFHFSRPFCPVASISFSGKDVVCTSITIRTVYCNRRVSAKACLALYTPLLRYYLSSTSLLFTGCFSVF